MQLTSRLKEHQQAGKAMLACNFYNYETLKGVIMAAKATGKPVILQLTRSSIEYMGLQTAVNMARLKMAEQNVEAYIHLDHGDSYDLAARCLDAGFHSVMIDGSELPFEENIALTRKVVNLAMPYHAGVEAELGYVAKLGQSKEQTGFTDPHEAKVFVEETGIDSLAVAIGTAHGFYKETPKLDMERLGQIRALIDIPLVLHGGSGIPDESLRAAIAKGICKVNLATEIKNTFMKRLQHDLSTSQEIDLRKVFPPAIQDVIDLVSRKILVVANA